VGRTSHTHFAAVAAASIYRTEEFLAATRSNMITSKQHISANVHHTLQNSPPTLLRVKRFRYRATNEDVSTQESTNEQQQAATTSPIVDKAFPKSGLFSIADPNAEVCSVLRRVDGM
jgi:hypothetical protein